MQTDRTYLIQILTDIQNSAKNHGRDLLTFTGFCSDDEVRDTIQREFADLDTARKEQIIERTYARMPVVSLECVEG